ncbi:hypothetical protein [Saccharicrinis aurantiacus]|uniref:hypothetical protein n=1 Tax=Saccharicrinis aurantiacus TaxID=1849719 RepID=UPI000837B6BA|nr:hypothetical protein [Saccharicrinis aurantiacus]
MKYSYWQLVLLLMVLQTSCKTTKHTTNSAKKLDAQPQTSTNTVATTIENDEEVIINSEVNLKFGSNELPSDLLEILTEGLEADGNGYYSNEYGIFFFNRINKLPPIITELFPTTIFFYSGVIASTYSKGDLGAYQNGEIRAPIYEFNILLDKQKGETTITSKIEALLYFKEGFDVEINNIKQVVGENNPNENRCIHIQYNVDNISKGINIYLDGDTFLYYQCTNCYNTVAKVHFRH